MKSIILVRHAKSSWNNPGVKDFDRPLNDRGERDSPVMARRLTDAGVIPSLLVSSPAVRAATTARNFAGVFGIHPKSIQFEEALYLAPPEVFTNLIRSLPDEHDTVFIFSHNPGITEFANRLTNTRIDDMPTCSVFAVKTDNTRWADFSEEKNEFWFFDYPKNPAF